MILRRDQKRGRANRRSSAATAMPPMARQAALIGADGVMIDPAANAARPMLSAKHFAHHLPYRKAIIGRALIKMRAMGCPEWLAPG